MGGLASSCGSKQCLASSRMLNGARSSTNGLAVSRELNNGLQDLDGLGRQVGAKRRKRYSWEVDWDLERLVRGLEDLASDLEKLLRPALGDLCRLAEGFTEFPEPRWGSTRVRARGREYEYDVLYLQTGEEFTSARKVYLTSDRRRELAAKYTSMYRKVADILKALKTYCLGAQGVSKPPRTSDQGLAASTPLNEGWRDEEV